MLRYGEGLPRALALDGSTLYWLSTVEIDKVPLDNPTANPFPNNATPVVGGEYLWGFTLDSTYVYFADSQYIRKTPK